MIRALVSGNLFAAPQQRTSKTGKPFAIARLSIPQGEEGRIFCSVIAFDDSAVKRLLQLKAGASVAVAGVLKVGTWTAKDGTVKPSLDMVADEVAATTPRPKKVKEDSPGDSRTPCFDDLPGCDDLGGQY